MGLENKYKEFLDHLEVVVKNVGVKKVAKRIGTSPNTVYSVFKPNAKPNMFTVLKICNAVGISFYFQGDDLYMARKFHSLEQTG